MSCQIKYKSKAYTCVHIYIYSLTVICLLSGSLVLAHVAFGGWDIKNLEWFEISFRMKSMWQLLTGNGIWNWIIAHKYLKNRPLEN